MLARVRHDCSICSIPNIVGATPLRASPGFGIMAPGTERVAFIEFAIEISFTAAEIPGRIPGNTYFSFSRSTGSVLARHSRTFAFAVHCPVPLTFRPKRF